MSQQIGPDQKQSFLDRGTIIALVLVGVVWFGWSKWVEKTYPASTASAPIAESTSAGNAPVGSAPGNSNQVASNSVAAPAAGTAAIEKSATNSGNAVSTRSPEVKEVIENTNWSTVLSSWGMGLSGIELKEYKTRDEKPIIVGLTPTPVFATKLLGAAETIDFKVAKISETEWKGVANFGSYSVEKTVKLIDKGAAALRTLEIVTVASGDLSAFPGFAVTVSDEVKAPASTSFLAPSYDHHDWFVRHEDTNTRYIIDPTKAEAIDHKTVYSVALSSHYFTAALADRSSLRPEFKSDPLAKQGDLFQASGLLLYKPISKNSEFKIEQTAYVGPKDVDALRAADAEFSRVVDYGMFAMLADPLLWLMRFFFGLTGNWGVAIIGLTLVVRAVVLPFNLYSFKSMKVMQQIQPQIQTAKEKFKDDPRRMNEEVMRLMKENKANPLGGCLPMLLQLPVFFALYQVLAQSIELYRQPFIFWINDLTVKDEFFVLPILMGIAMYFQQKLTPIADPQQAKILQWMPVIFAVLMFTLPSGLTLYIFVSTLFGIAQQYVFMKDKSAAKTQNNVREAKA